MKALVLIALLVGCTPAQRHVGLATTSTVVMGVDYLQTQVITGTCTEQNPILGKCGERTPVGPYFAAGIVLHLAIGALLPAKYRTAWFGTTTLVEAATVGDNYRTGIRF